MIFCKGDMRCYQRNKQQNNLYLRDFKINLAKIDQQGNNQDDDDYHRQVQVPNYFYAVLRSPIIENKE